ncbi:nuclear receptor subfamily 5 group A member 2-like [Physella acuta]|uniref:nuclear receptor subfamily 5 group A member 2-like n=1 Tax=Physella acuta TaxID=109671 RepID=UPI0027DE3BE3|nr:nuclear receptor subfamily 5 group A member 2-like [Physella acuta]
MIEASEILDLTDGNSAERSNDDQHAHGAILGSGHPLLPGRQTTQNISSLVSIHDIEEMTPNDEQNASSMVDQDVKDVKIGFEELCPVCGDKVSGYHYGLLTCESCKGFFKRTVQNKKVYSCVDNRNCQIDKSQRKRCPYCRFQKCLSVGMKLEAVRSDRMRGGRNKFGPMYKRDRALKQQAARQAHVIHGSCGDIPLLTNGMMGGGTPGSPEDVKPDPLLLQASLSLYSGTISTSTTSNLISGLIPGLNCVSASAAAPSSSASTGGGHNGSSSPPTAHPHHISHNSHQNSHQSLVPMTASQGFSNSFVHIPTLAVPQPQSPKSHYSQQHRHHHNSQLLQQQQHSPLGRGDQSPVGHHHQQHHVQQQQQHMQALSDIQMQSGHGQNQLHNLMPQRRHANNNGANSTSVRAGGQENEPHFPPTSSQASPTVIEALRAFQIQSPNIGLDRSVLSPLIAEIKSTMGDETEVKHKMLTFMQNELSQTDILSSPEQFLPVLCRMVDQLLFLMVEWARNSSFFKEIKVEDQMKLLHNSWSEILILDFIYRQIHNIWGKEINTPNGPGIGFEILDKLGLGDVKAKVFELIKKGRELKMDFNEYMCLKFLILLSPDVSSLENRSFIEQSQEKVNAALFHYCLMCYPEMSDKFSQLLMRLPEIRLISIRMEDFLYFKHMSNEVPDQTLLTEMLHAKRRG